MIVNPELWGAFDTAQQVWSVFHSPALSHRLISGVVIWSRFPVESGHTDYKQSVGYKFGWESLFHFDSRNAWFWRVASNIWKIFNSHRKLLYMPLISLASR